ncbi:NAD(P)H-dependent glycerol-3-phosphate dehydrogenase [Mycoplasma miroungirhinis]|uniref:Glycerol-3-phosphate dehydrogenase [NAD(P)+] n=1 Tax=Mycoplasma miroungirhinis TaxID=754516 RepID=A0A6M4JCF4_9MOLU|nr:NAD(P)H-dependent glycerol-3-phosphate dehydrogenase [Mycoplasma miroungirhinis]QJR44025.1 NAD(P)H-dependent glycerol-3-phosphate dehydrogenase [Mycoplasma miroungirhinis]
MKQNTNENITIIGSGSMGTALAKVLFNNGHNVTIYGIDNQELKELREGKNTKYFPETTYLPNFKTTNNLKEALYNTNYVVFAVPSKLMDDAFKKTIENLQSQVVLINVAKGFYPNTITPLHTEFKNLTKNNLNILGVVSLIGPSHAEEIVKDSITVVDAVDENIEIAKKVQNLFSNHYFRVYTQTDVIGAEIGSIFKNVLAIASGILYEKNYGINTRAALITRGLVEMKKYALYNGGKLETLFGLTGIGDLIVTAFSEFSRNFSFGKLYGKIGKEALNTQKTVEGLTALKAIYENVIKTNLMELPITNGLYQVIFNDYDINEMLNKLITRDLKEE